MAGAQRATTLRHIQRLFSEGSFTGLSDTQLLSRFALRRDEAAFTALVARHGADGAHCTTRLLAYRRNSACRLFCATWKV
jgi:hypothetical protein